MIFEIIASFDCDNNLKTYRVLLHIVYRQGVSGTIKPLLGRICGAAEARDGVKDKLLHSIMLLSPRRPWMSHVTTQSLRSDAIAGLTNAAIVLPQGVAFAVIAGLPPEYGLYAAMVTPVVAAIWGSSMVMVSGPTTAISAVIFATISSIAPPGTDQYVAIALSLTILVGCFQLAAGLLRLGGPISFISHSVMVGFTSAAAVLIAISQLGNATGLTVQGKGVLDRVLQIAPDIHSANIAAVFLSAATFIAILVSQRLDKRLPAYFIALIFGSILGWLISAPAYGIAMFSELPSIAPAFSVPQLDPQFLSSLAPGAATVALIGLLEAISIGRTFAIRRGEKYDTNQEIVGQGMSNLVGGFFQAYAGSGSFTRSGLNAESGARTPLSAIFAAVFLFFMLVLTAPLVTYIPVPVMGGVIIAVAFKLINTVEIRRILKSRSETMVLAGTFITGIVTQLDIAIVVGVITSLMVFLKQSSNPFVSVLAPAVEKGQRSFRNVDLYDLPECPQIRVLRMEGPLFFGSVEQLDAEFERVGRYRSEQKIQVFSLKGIGRLDLAGADFLIKQVRDARRAGGDFHLVGMYPSLLRRLHSMHVLKVLGESNLHVSKGHAIAAAADQVDPAFCAGCTLRVFSECRSKPAPDGLSADSQTRVIQTTNKEIKRVRPAGHAKDAQPF